METSTEGSQQKKRQPTTTPTTDGTAARPFTNIVTATEGRQQNRGQVTTTLTPGGAVARPSTETVTASEGWLTGLLFNPALSNISALWRRSVNNGAWTRQSNVQQHEHQSIQLGHDDTCQPSQLATEARQQQGRQPTTTLTPDGGVARLYTDDVTAIEARQQQGRQPTTTLTPDGTVARLYTDTVTATEATQHQGIQSFTTTTHTYLPGCTVSHYDMSNSSNIAVGDSGHRGCISQESLSIRINQLSDVFVQTRSLYEAEDLLKRHNHLAICGAPGDGKTTAALRICKSYMKKNYRVLFVENIEEFDIDVVIKRKCDMLVVFDDIFGSVAFPSSLEKIRKVFNALVDILLRFRRDEELVAKEERQKKMKTGMMKKDDERQCDDKTTKKSNYKLRFIFTSRNYNWNEGCARLHQFKVNLFKPETIVDMIKTCLTIEEKKQIMTLFRIRSQIGDISNEDMKTITELKDSVFGYPLTCKLYFTNPEFQMHSLVDFFLKPVTYLRGDLDTIVREGSSRSAALILLVLCEGKLNLASFMTGTDKKITDLFHVVKEKVAPCTDTDIEREIHNFTGTYCVVENHVASFSHPAIHDAAACALGNLNSVLLVKHCSLQFLYERVRTSMSEARQTSQVDDVTNMIYITSGLYPLIVNRLVEGIREGCFRWTVGHPVFRGHELASSLMTELANDLPDVVHQKDNTSGECFLYWTSLSNNDLLFRQSLLMMTKQENVSPENVKDLYDSIAGCIKAGKMGNLQRIVNVLKQHGEYNADKRMAADKTLLIIAAEAGQLEAFNFLLQEGANVSAKDKKGNSCLHHACISGKRDIVKVVVEMCPGMIDDWNHEGFTSTSLCAETGQEEILKFLVSHGGSLSVKTFAGQSCLHMACANGHVSTIQYMLSCESININERTASNTTPIMIAAEKGHSDVFHLLVSEGADVSLTDDMDRDCLMYASIGGNVSIMRQLLSLGIFKTNRRDCFNCTAVIMAAEAGHSDVYHFLVSEGADVSFADNNGRDCLMYACERGSMSIIRHQLSLATSNINRRYQDDMTPLLIAAKAKHSDVYDLLVSEGADVSLTDDLGGNCLMWACHGGSMSVLRHLLSLNKININTRYCDIWAPVMIAAMARHSDVYDLLVSEGADVSVSDNRGRDCLMHACERGNMSIVRHQLSLKTMNINRRDHEDMTPVMIAAKAGHSDVYDLLVSEGADVSVRDNKGRDCLMHACERGNMSIVRHLLSLKTTNINKRDHDNMTPVMIAAKAGHSDVYHLLVSEGADVSLTGNMGRDCLMYACMIGNLSIVRHVVSKKIFNINRRDCNSMTPIMIAAEKGLSDVFHLLVSEGADVSLTDDKGQTCFMYACKGGNVSLVRRLLSLKTVNINRRDCNNMTPVMVAASAGHADIYHLLVSEGADVSLSDNRGSDCLMYSCRIGNMSIVKHLLSLNKININKRDDDKMTPVMIAALAGHADVCYLLVSEGADLSLTDDMGRDCLMYACMMGNVSIVKHLLRLKKDIINRRDHFNCSAVTMAVKDGYSDVYHILVSDGADVSLTDDQDRDCLMYACERGNISVVRHLLTLETVNINKRYQDNMTPVMIAAATRHSGVYQLLVSEGADLSLTDNWGRDCLMQACERGNISIVRHLLSLKTININRRDHHSMTPVMVAAFARTSDVYELLVSEGADLSLTDNKGRDCLMLACERGNMYIVRHLLSLKTININRRDDDNMTPAMIAATTRHSDIFHLLVSEGADVSLTDNWGRDCLMYASVRGNMSIVRHLLSLKTININRRDHDNMTAVMISVRAGHPFVYHLLASEGADVSLTDNKGRDCLMQACERNNMSLLLPRSSGNISIVRHLLSLKTININRRDHDNMTPAMIAAIGGCSDVFHLLVSEGADVSLTDKRGRDCLMYACEGGNMSIVKHLLTLKLININRRDHENMTPVMIAATTRHSDILHLLVSEGADVSLTDNRGRDYLMLACERGNMSIVKHLLTLKSINIDKRDHENMTAVMIAASAGHSDVYHLLVSEGADVSLTDNKGRDCLMQACERNALSLLRSRFSGNIHIVRHLLSLKTININRRDHFNLTPVMIAAKAGHSDIYHLLVSKGADVSLTDNKGRDCLMQACEKDSESEWFPRSSSYITIVKHLLSLKTVSINRRDYSNMTPVMIAASAGHSDIYHLLVSEGADLSLTDNRGRDCLMYSCDGGNISIVRHLLSLKTININRRDHDNMTPAMIAATTTHSDIFHLLVSEGADMSLTDVAACGPVHRGQVTIRSSATTGADSAQMGDDN